MTPLQHEPLRTQHYLYLHDPLATVPVVVGFFPWNGTVVMVGFDGTHPDALENLAAHSWTRVVSVDEARRWWSQYTDTHPQRLRPYTTVPPDADTAARLRVVCMGLACRARDKVLEKQNAQCVDYFDAAAENQNGDVQRCVEQCRDALREFVDSCVVRDEYDSE